MKKVTKEQLKEWKACVDGYRWWLANCEGLSNKKQIKKLIDSPDMNWANWLVVRMLSPKDKIKYAVFAAEQIIELYEKKYPDDNRPRLAIEAAKIVIKRNTKRNRNAADAAYAAAYAAALAAADAAYAAADAADAAYAAALAAADAAYAAAYAAANAAYAAAYAAYAAADAAYAAAYAAANAAANAAYAARRKMKIKIINYGITLLKKEEGK